MSWLSEISSRIRDLLVFLGKDNELKEGFFLMGKKMFGGLELVH